VFDRRSKGVHGRRTSFGTAALVFVSLLFPVAVFAHRPVVVKEKSSRAEPVVVKEPEISWAFYGVLAGEPHDMSFAVFRESAGEKPLFAVEGPKAVWRRYYEKYGRDHYYMGPEYDARADHGVYYVKVFNGSNGGRYALAIGEREQFTFFSLIGTIVRAQSLDRWFFI
jgi:hypothetical protein